MSQDSSTTSELTIDVTCTPRNRANLRRLKTSSVQSYQRWEKENELLYAMIEDESAWLTRLFPDAFLTPELFFYALEDGTILCRMANFIQEMADKYGVRTGKSVPGKKFTFHKSKRGSRESKLFHSRENVDKFLTWCRWHGIPEAVLFESNDAVLVDECRTGGREIVICLMEIARRSSKYEIQEVPQLIKLEREIEKEELSDVPSCANEQQGLALDTSTVNIGTRGDRSSPTDSDSGVESVFEEGDPASPRLMEFFADETTPEPTKVIPKGKNMNKSERDKKPQRAIQKDERSLLESSQPKTELDEKVCKIAQEYNIKIVHRLKEGKYIILGKTMFVRMLNDHLLVRIGGGWDTLNHYVMTHASKSTEGTLSTLLSSADHKSSGVWSKLVEKVKRRESQPNITESPVVISKRERPDSSPSVYRLRDRVRKKLSVTEKDEKDISDAIRKIESSVTKTVISSHSPSFTSKTFFQLKNRFDKGRKLQLSRENIFDKKESNKMADQNVEIFTTDEQRREAETKQEGRSATTMLLESQKPSEPNEITESTKRVQEEFSTSTTTVTEPLSSDFQFESGKEDFHAEIDDDSQQSLEHFTPGDDDFLSFDQQTQESTVETENQSFPTIKSDDIFFNDNPPLFHSEAQQPEPVQDEEQSTVNKDELMLEEESRVEVPPADDQEPSKYLSSDTDLFAEIAQGIQFQPLRISPEAEQTEPNPFVLEPEESDAKSNIEGELEKILQEPPAANQADSFPEVAGDVQLETIKVSYESEEAESAPFVLLPQADQPEGQEHQEQPGEQVQEGNEDRAPEISMEYTGGVSNEPEPECDGLPAEVTGGSDVALETETPLEDVQSPKTAVKDVGYMVSQKEDKEKNEMVVQNMFTTDKGEEPEDNGLQAQITETDLLIPVEVDKNVLPKDEEEFEDRECPAQIDDYAHDSKIEEQTLPEIANVVESEEKADGKEPLANIVNVEKSSKEEMVITQLTEMAPPALSQNVEEPKAEQNEAKDVPPVKNTAPVSHKKQTKKVPGASKKKHEKSVTTVTSKNFSGSKKEDHKAERPKGSATRPTASRTAKTTSATTASKAKTVPAAPTARSTSTTKRPPSAPNAKSGSGISKPPGPKMPANGVSKAGTKTTPKSSQPQNPPGAGNLRPTSMARDKKAPPSSGTQKAESKSRPHSAVSTTSTDKADGKVESPQPLSTKTKPLSGTTRTTVKKTTTSTTKSTIGPASVSEVSKTTVTTSKGGIKSSASTTTKKSTEPGGRTKSLKETTPHQKASARNKVSEMRSGMHGKPGSASTKTKPPSATTRERAGSAMTKEKPGSERPKSPTKGAPKKLAAAKHEEPKAPVEVKSATEPAAITAPIVPGASDVITPDGITDTKEDVTRVIQHTEMVEDDGETKIVHTKEVIETVTENGEQQIVTTEETVVEASGYPSKIIT